MLSLTVSFPFAGYLVSIFYNRELYFVLRHVQVIEAALL